jgi:hypothetical protein
MALAFALRHLLRTLARKGIMNRTETTAMLDNALDELRALKGRGGLSPDEAA